MDQPRLSPDLRFAVASINVAVQWEWPTGWSAVISYRREGSAHFDQGHLSARDADELLRRLDEYLASVLGLM